MAQPGGRIGNDTRSTHGAIVTDAFREIDALRLALIREQSGNTTQDDRRLIKRAKQSGRNLDEIRALTSEGIQAYLETPPVFVNGKNGEGQKSNGKAPKVAYREGNGNKGNGSMTSAAKEVVIVGAGSADQNQDVAPLVGNESGFVQEGKEQIASDALELGALPISGESSADSIISSARVEGQAEGFTSLSDAEITVFLATNDGIEELREPVSPKPELRLNFHRPKFGPPATPKVTRMMRGEGSLVKNILEPEPEAHLREFRIDARSLVGDRTYTVYLGQGFAVEPVGEVRDVVARVSIVGLRGEVGGRKEQR